MRTYDGCSYEHARAHITRHRRQTSILIEPYTKMGTLDDWETIIINWSYYFKAPGLTRQLSNYYNDFLIGYYPDGNVVLGVPPGKIYPSVINIWNKWTPVRDLGVQRIKSDSTKGYRRAGLHTGNYGKTRNWKCRKCRGYQWQGKEIERTLAELMIPAHELNILQRMNVHTWDYWRTYRNLSKEQQKHVMQCEQCSGTGRYDYGRQPELFEIHEGMVLDQNGDVVCGCCSSAWEEATERSST